MQYLVALRVLTTGIGSINYSNCIVKLEKLCPPISCLEREFAHENSEILSEIVIISCSHKEGKLNKQNRTLEQFKCFT